MSKTKPRRSEEETAEPKRAKIEEAEPRQSRIDDYASDDYVIPSSSSSASAAWEPLLSHVGWWDAHWSRKGSVSDVVDRVEKPKVGNGYRVILKGAAPTLTAVLGPFRVFKAYGAPLGNWQCDDYKYTPRKPDQIGEVKFKYTYSNNGESFKERDAASSECVAWMHSVDVAIEAAFNKAELGQPYRLKLVEPSKKDQTAVFVHTSWMPFSDIDQKERAALALYKERKYKSMNILFDKYCNSNVQQMNAPPMYRLNPAHAGDPTRPRLIPVAAHEQAAWSRQDDVHFLRVSFSRIGGKDYQRICADVEAILTLGTGPAAAPHPSPRDSYALIEERETDTPEASYRSKRVQEDKDAFQTELEQIKQANQEHYNNPSI